MEKVVEHRTDSGYVSATLSGQAANPLVPFAPSINYSLNLLIDPQTNAVDVAFGHTDFPSFQIFYNGQPVFNYEEQGDAMNLYNTVVNTFSINGSTNSSNECDH
jgi:hypothetical protein